MFLLSCSYQLPVPAPKCARPISDPHKIWPLPQPPHVLLLRISRAASADDGQGSLDLVSPMYSWLPCAGRSCQLASHCYGEGGCVSFGYEEGWTNVWPSSKGRLLEPVLLTEVGSGFQAQDVEEWGRFKICSSVLPPVMHPVPMWSGKIVVQMETIGTEDKTFPQKRLNSNEFCGQCWNFASDFGEIKNCSKYLLGERNSDFSLNWTGAFQGKHENVD